MNAWLSGQKDLFSEVSWRVLNVFDHGKQYDSFFYNNYLVYLKLFDGEARIRMSRMINRWLKVIVAAKDKDQFDQIISFMEKNKFGEKKVLETKLSFYSKTALDWRLFNELLNRYITAHDGNITQFASDVLKERFPKQLGQTFVHWIDAQLKTGSTPLLYI